MLSNDDRFLPTNVSNLADFRYWKNRRSAALRVGAAPPPPAPADGEDDEIPNEPEGR